MNILLLGCNGQVGWELQRALDPLGTVTACDFDSPGELKADFLQSDSLVPLVRRLRPQVIVNAAAHTAVDKAESEPDRARALNATAPGVLAREAAALGALLVHYSTDYVFDGSGDGPRTEDAPTGPLSVYGRTKLEGEELIRQSGARHLILRTSWVYATHGGNFVKTMLRLAAERESLNVISDQIGAPTGAELLADVTAHAIRTIQGQYQGRGQTTTSFVHATAPLQGTFHCVAAGETSWFDYARFIIEWARSEGQPIKVAPDAILPIPTSSYPTPAQRPLNSRLDSSRLRDAYGLELPDWRRGVVRMLREFVRSQGSSKLVRPD